MPSQARNTGPVTIWVAPKAKGFNGSILYLGTGEVAPTSEIRHEFEPVMNDLAGSRVPFDEIYQGSHGFTAVDLTSWEETTLQAIESLPNRTTNARGSRNVIDHGSLMLTEGLAYQMWLLFTSNSHFPDMPDGMHFWASWLMGPSIRTTGTRANKIHCVWRHLSVFNKKTGAMELFDHDVSAVAGKAIT